MDLQDLERWAADVRAVLIETTLSRDVVDDERAARAAEPLGHVPTEPTEGRSSAAPAALARRPTRVDRAPEPRHHLVDQRRLADPPRSGDDGGEANVGGGRESTAARLQGGVLDAR